MKIRELEKQAKSDHDFIELQACRLLNAREHVARIRRACDTLMQA